MPIEGGRTPPKTSRKPTMIPVGHLATPLKINRRPVAIVTGAIRGIGAAIAAMLGGNGFDVAVNYSEDAEGARQVVEALRTAGAGAIGIQADISQEIDVLRLFDTAERELGPVRALVNNAAVTGGFARVEDVDAGVLARMIAVNIGGTVLCSRQAVRRMSTRRGGEGGAIVNISSIAARTGSAGEWVPYAASKGAVNTFTIGLAREVAADGIRVNAVAPGLIETGLHAANGEPGRVTRFIPKIAMGRAGTAAEIASGVLWLLSAEASYRWRGASSRGWRRVVRGPTLGPNSPEQPGEPPHPVHRPHPLHHLRHHGHRRPGLRGRRRLQAGLRRVQQAPRHFQRCR